MPTVTLRPNVETGLSYGATWSVTGAASRLAAVNDNSDSSFIRATDTSSVDFSLPAATIPAGSAMRSAVLSIRGRVDFFPGGFAPYVVLYRADGSSASDTRPSTPSGSFATFSAGAALINAGEVCKVSVFAAGGGATSDFADVWVDVTYASKPTTSVIAPAGTITTTSRPLIQWGHTAGADGGAQSSFDVKVFTAAQYGAGGFDPSTSTPTWSTAAYGSASSITPTALANDTYRVYVRTAQTINGASHWADWVYSGFVLNAVPPVVLSVTATGDDTLARNRIVVSRDTGGPAWDHIDVQRSDDGGTTWVPVRGGSNVAVQVDQWIGYDYEAANGLPALYRARAANGDIVGAYTVSAAPASWSSPDVWLRNLRYPALSRTITTTAPLQPTWDIAQGIHYAVGRADPVVISDTRQMSSGAFTVELFTLAEEQALRSLLDGDPVLLQFPSSMQEDQVYLTPGRVRRDRQSEIACSGWRYLDVDYTEVAMPPDDGIGRLGVGQSWDDYLAATTTWAQALTADTTWGDLA